jgi:glucans biosynthesis protein
MHGGAEGSGAPKGNRNALKHGIYTKEALRQRAELRGLMQECQDLLLALKQTQ